MGVAVISADSLTQAVGTDGSLSLLDKKLLKWAGAGLSPQDISDRLDGVLTPAQAGQRTREILRSTDWLSILERRSLILQDLIELKEILMSRVRQEGGVIEDKDGTKVHSFGDPRWAAALTKVLSEMNKLISTEQANLDVERKGLRASHARVFVRAVEMAYDSMARQVLAEYPMVKPEMMRAALEEAVPFAITSIDESVLDDDRADDEGGF